MEIYKHTNKDDITATQAKLQADFHPLDTWGVIEVPAAPEHAEKAFCDAIRSRATEKELVTYQLLAQQFPDKYRGGVTVEGGKLRYTVHPTPDGTRILFVTNFAQRPIKKIFSTKAMGAGRKIHTMKIRNRFEPSGWRAASWFFVARALITGNEEEFSTVGSYR